MSARWQADYIRELVQLSENGSFSRELRLVCCMILTTRWIARMKYICSSLDNDCRGLPFLSNPVTSPLAPTVALR
jgi:hypothetical protein